MAASMLPWAVCTMAGGLRGNVRMADENGHAVGARHDEVEQDKADLSRGVGLERVERLVAAIGRGDADSRTA